jgi:hypothetical protein
LGSFRNRVGTELFYSLYKPSEKVFGKVRLDETVEASAASRT